MNSIYAIDPANEGATLRSVWNGSGGSGLAAGYTSLVPVELGRETMMFAYDKASQQLDVYALSAGGPELRTLAAPAALAEGPWDSLSHFVLGNEAYLMAYRADNGTFGFFRVERDASLCAPYLFALPRNTPTRGFSTVATYSSLGKQYFTGYSIDTGIVANFSLDVTARSAPGVPPLLALNVWYHQWAKGWSHFAFFQMGGANFFFKINLAKLNVNIDHMQDNPAMGSVEVGSNMQGQLPDALAIDIAAALPWQGGAPWLLSYIGATGKTALYRVDPDCQGWTCAGEAVTVPGATQAIPYCIDGTTYVLFYQA
jgi:hypothetical protein